jgi:hypothetical protein
MFVSLLAKVCTLKSAHCTFFLFPGVSSFEYLSLFCLIAAVSAVMFHFNAISYINCMLEGLNPDPENAVSSEVGSEDEAVSHPPPEPFPVLAEAENVTVVALPSVEAVAAEIITHPAPLPLPSLETRATPSECNE